MIIIRTFVIAMLVLMPMTVQAQVQLPQFSISDLPTIQLGPDLNQDYEVVFSRIKNPIMRDTLRLQYQINLLERLIRRQTEIQRIAESYKSIGIPFNQPAPPETACRQLPVNVLCMAFYPESEKYKELVEERKEEFVRDQRRQMETMMLNIQNGDFDADSSDQVAEMMQQAPTSPDRKYIWSDIRCLSGKCSALLIDRDDSNTRFRIRNGEDLPDENGVVTKISTSGVVARFEGENYTLQPEAAGGAQQVDPRPDTSGIANLLSDNLGDAALNSTAMQAAQSDQAIAPQAVPSDNDAPAPMLGATGLF